MKNFHFIFACTAVAATVLSTSAQVRWNPAEWQVVDEGNTRLVDKDHMEVVVTPVSGKDHCHIYNAVDLSFTAEEPYLIIHFEASEGIRANKQHSMFKFYNDFENYNNLSAEEIDGYNGYVFDQTFNVDKGDGYVVYRGKYDAADEDIFTNGWIYTNTVERGNIWVIDMRQVPTKNGGYVFGKDDVENFSITHTRAPWWTDVEGAPARMKSALQIEICANVIPDGTTKAEFLDDKSVQYRYIATASPFDILTDAAMSRANNADIDPAKVKKLIDDYRANAALTGDYVEHRDIITTGIGEVYSNAVAVFAVNGNQISCRGAESMELYNVTGTRVASVNDERVEAQSGLYIARAIDAEGNVLTGKIIVR